MCCGLIDPVADLQEHRWKKVSGDNLVKFWIFNEMAASKKKSRFLSKSLRYRVA